MIRNRTARASLAGLLFLAGITMAPVALAEGGIVKCIGRDGQVTLTDTACQSGERSVTLVAPASGAAPAPVAVEPAVASMAAPPTLARTVRMAHARLPTRMARPALGRLDPPSRSLARDVLTLKAARQAMILMDGAAGAMRNGRVAGLH